jgi:hypothetical protein
MTTIGQALPQNEFARDPNLAGNQAFLDAIAIEHGPPAILGRVFLKGASAAQARGVTLSIESLEDLDAFISTHLKDWPALPVFRPEYQPTDRTMSPSFAILGRNQNGDVIATQAARFFDWTGTSLKAEAESLRMFFGSNPALANASCEVTSLEAGALTGRTVYSGATWFHPDYRGRELSSILPRLSRALALTRWNTDQTISFMDWRIVKKGVAESYGYRNLGASITLRNIVDPEFVAAIGWIPQAELLRDADDFLSRFPVEWTETVDARRRNQAG